MWHAAIVLNYSGNTALSSIHKPPKGNTSSWKSLVFSQIIIVQSIPFIILPEEFSQLSLIGVSQHEHDCIVDMCVHVLATTYRKF